MLLFGHAGLTLGLALLLARVTTDSACARNSKVRLTEASNRNEIEMSGVKPLADYDARLLLVGSLLPDIIDKPVGQFFFRETFSNGRIFGHTFLFFALISIIGFYLYRYGHKTWLLVLSFGTFTHLIFDQMWLASHTLLWPLYGFAFEREELTDWTNILHGLVTNPQVYLPELAGIAILVWFTQSLVRRRRAFAFIKHGQV